MKAYKIRQILGSILFGGIIGAGLMSIGIARSHADPDSITLTPTEAQFYVKNANLICQNLTLSPYDSTMDMLGKEIMQAGFSAESAARIVVVSVTTLCPENTSVVRHYGAHNAQATV